jgi:hypothetical protein
MGSDGIVQDEKQGYRVESSHVTHVARPKSARTGHPAAACVNPPERSTFSPVKWDEIRRDEKSWKETSRDGMRRDAMRWDATEETGADGMGILEERSLTLEVAVGDERRRERMKWDKRRGAYS